MFLFTVLTKPLKVSGVRYAGLFIVGLLFSVATLAQQPTPIPRRVEPTLTPQQQAYQGYLNTTFGTLLQAPTTPLPSGTLPIDDPEKRLLFERLRTMDPATLIVPLDKLEAARQQVQAKIKSGGPSSSLPSPVTWNERGPNNIGGRTRALLFDPNDATKKKVWAGAIDGGLWYNTDITNANSTWQKVNDFWDNLAISCLVSDPSNTSVIYAGTGEGWFNGDAVQGGGIWKTTDAGATWNRLTSTIPVFSSPTIMEQAFQTVQRMVVNSSGEVFAATKRGVLKSTNGGSTWTFVLDPSQTIGTTNAAADYVSDLEIGTDGILWAGFGHFTESGSRIYKATTTAATSWTLLYSNSSGLRTELALDPSSSGNTQVVYAMLCPNPTTGTGISIRSADGGATWVTKTVPSTNFTGQLWYDLGLKVHPTNPDVVYAGAQSWSRSTNGAATAPWAFQDAYYGQMHPDQHFLVFRPGFPNEVIIGNDGGIYYSPNFGDITVTSPTFSSRNKGYNVTQLYSIAQKNVANDNFLVGGAQDNGTNYTNTAIGSTGAGTSLRGGDGMFCFIDQDNPNVVIASYQYNQFGLYNGSGGYVRELTSVSGSFIDPSDYDSPNNILYTQRTYSSGIVTLDRITGVGSTNTAGTVVATIAALGNPPSVIRAGLNSTTVFLGGYNGTLFKLTSVDATPVVTQIDNGLLPGGTITSIELGGSESVIIVTLSNYNTKSVWYTADGGTTWISKDESTHGLPDIPVRWSITNPANRKQVLLATELGVWYTNDISAANPGWSVANTNLANVRCDMLRYRSVDGLVAVGTHGRGMFTTDFFSGTIATNIELADVTGPVCRSSTVNVSFSTTGTFAAGNTFTVQFSDATGGFTSPVVSNTVTPYAPNTVTVPNSLTAAGSYRLRVVSSNPVVASTGSNTFAIGNGNLPFSAGMPTLTASGATSFLLTSAVQQPGITHAVLVNTGNPAPTPAQIKLGQNNTGSAAFRAVHLTEPAANMAFTSNISGLQPGTSYTAYFTNEDPGSGCLLAPAISIGVSTTGTSQTYCTPTYINGCSATTPRLGIDQVTLTNTTLNNVGSGCSNNSYGNFTGSVHAVLAGTTYPVTIGLIVDGGSYYQQHIAIWIDANRDGVFSNTADELLYQTQSGQTLSNFMFGNLTIPASLSAGTVQMRVRTQYFGHGIVANPCVSYSYGEAEDYTLEVGGTPGGLKADLSLAMSLDKRLVDVNQPVTYKLNLANAGTNPAESIVVGARLPANLTYGSGTGLSYNYGLLTGTVNQLAVGTTTSLTFTAQPTQPGVYYTSAQIISSSLPDPDSQTNSGTGDGQDDTATADFRTPTGNTRYESPNPQQTPLPPVQPNQPTPDPAKADLSLAMVTNTRTASVGDPITFTATVSNRGGLGAGSIIVRDTLRGLTFVSSPTGATIVSTTAGYSILQGTVASVSANGEGTLIFVATPQTGGHLVNAAEIWSVGSPGPNTPLDPDSQPGSLTPNTNFNGQDDLASVDLRIQGAGSAPAPQSLPAETVATAPPFTVWLLTKPSRELNVQVNMAQKGAVGIAVLNRSNELQQQWPLKAASTHTLKASLSSLPVGVYYLVVTGVNYTYRYSFDID